MGMQYWSLSHVIKQKVKEAVKFINHFETLLSAEAKRKNVDGVVCGHIHNACFKNIDGIEYYNCGSWLEQCNAVVEHMDGKMQIIKVA